MEEDPVRLTEREKNLLDSITSTIFTNIKIYIEEKMAELGPFLQEQIDVRNNLVTLSSLLATKNLFTEKEFRECFQETIKSFGVVKQDGSMDGDVFLFAYNLEERKENESN